tara:strand:- start:16 stop:879 length:864 start_codon:yes stop_codon:yes gene_type:complete
MTDLSAEQSTAIDLALAALDRCEDFVIKGRAGTGKSRLIKALLHKLPGSVVAAPTHKACGVLKTYGVPAVTLHAALGISVVKYGYGYGSSDIDDGLVFGPATKYLMCPLIVDECSLVGSQMHKDLSNNAIGGVIYVGDPYQLPPVGEYESAPFKNTLGYELTEVFRGHMYTRLRRLCQYVLNVLTGDEMWSIETFKYWMVAGRDSSVVIPARDEYLPYDVFLTYTNRRAECLPYGLTVHSAQGSEWNVVMVDLNHILKATNDMMFNLRLLYVALTRANETAIIYTVE